MRVASPPTTTAKNNNNMRVSMTAYPFPPASLPFLLPPCPNNPPPFPLHGWVGNTKTEPPERLLSCLHVHCTLPGHTLSHS